MNLKVETLDGDLERAAQLTVFLKDQIKQLPVESIEHTKASAPPEGARKERTTTQTDPFQANPLGRGQLADFRRCSLLTYRLRYARRYCQSGSDRLENQPTDRRRYASYL